MPVIENTIDEILVAVRRDSPTNQKVGKKDQNQPKWIVDFFGKASHK